jgi:hypothetical protein
VAVLVVVGVLAVGAVAGVLVTRRHTLDVEPTVREFAEFRDALSQQVDGLTADTRATRHHLDLHAHPRPVPPEPWG